MMLVKPDERELRAFAHASAFEDGKDFLAYLERARAKLAEDLDVQDGPQSDKLKGARLALKDLAASVQRAMGKNF